MDAKEVSPKIIRHVALSVCLTLAVCLTLGLGVAPVMAQPPEAPAVADPWERFNRAVFAFNETLDEYVIRPVAQGYRKVTPEFLDRGITNLFRNLDDVVVFANSLFQLKGHTAAVSLSRVLFNSTFGIGGFFDVATGFDLMKQEEDFGQTLGYWGVGSGPYLVLPVLGPSTVRDGIGRIPDIYLDPLYHLVDIPESIWATVVDGIDRRADLIPGESLIIGDHYVFIRNAYLQRRDYLIKDGQVDDPFASDEIDEDFDF